MENSFTISPSDQQSHIMSLPTVSVITPTYNRHAFIEQLIRCVRLQDYPQHLIELLIMDDSPEPIMIEDAWRGDLNIRVILSEQKLTLGMKRNSLNRFAKGKIIIPFDDDDYYPPTRISHAVERLQTSGKQLAGATLLFMWFPHSEHVNSLYLLGPYGPNHSCNGAMAYTQAYAKKFQYDVSKNKGEEPAFTKNFTHPMVQLNPALTMMSIAHTQNTVHKDEKFLTQCTLPNPEKFPDFPQSNWLDFVKDEQSIAFYQRIFKLNAATE